MSIYVSISRLSEPSAEDGPQIAANEWVDLVAQETDFRAQEGEEWKWVGAFARVWTGHPEYPAITFDWTNGQVDVKNADAPTVVRMKALARKLGATVFSEQGEVFDDAGESAGFLDGYP
jgi:hypothetical protein